MLVMSRKEKKKTPLLRFALAAAIFVTVVFQFAIILRNEVGVSIQFEARTERRRETAETTLAHEDENAAAKTVYRGSPEKYIGKGFVPLSLRPFYEAAAGTYHAIVGNVQLHRMYCMVPSMYPKKVEQWKAIMETWGKQCDVLRFFVEAHPDTPHEYKFMGKTIPIIHLNMVRNDAYKKKQPPCNDGMPCRHIWEKVWRAWVYVYTHPEELDSADWFFKIDDDTLVNPETVKRTILRKRWTPDEGFYFGHKLYHQPGGLQLIAGAMTGLSRAALLKLVPLYQAMPREYGDRKNFKHGRCVDRDGATEEKTTSLCVRKAGIKPTHTRDQYGRESVGLWFPGQASRNFRHRRQGVPRIILQGWYWKNKPRDVASGIDSYSPELMAVHGFKGYDKMKRFWDLIHKMPEEALGSVVGDGATKCTDSYLEKVFSLRVAIQNRAENNAPPNKSADLSLPVKGTFSSDWADLGAIVANNPRAHLECTSKRGPVRLNKSGSLDPRSCSFRVLKIIMHPELCSWMLFQRQREPFYHPTACSKYELKSKAFASCAQLTWRLRGPREYRKPHSWSGGRNGDVYYNGGDVPELDALLQKHLLPSPFVIHAAYASVNKIGEVASLETGEAYTYDSSEGAHYAKDAKCADQVKQGKDLCNSIPIYEHIISAKVEPWSDSVGYLDVLANIAPYLHNIQGKLSVPEKDIRLHVSGGKPSPELLRKLEFLGISGPQIISGNAFAANVYIPVPPQAPEGGNALKLGFWGLLSLRTHLGFRDDYDRDAFSTCRNKGAAEDPLGILIISSKDPAWAHITTVLATELKARFPKWASPEILDPLPTPTFAQVDKIRSADIIIGNNSPECALTLLARPRCSAIISVSAKEESDAYMGAAMVVNLQYHSVLRINGERGVDETIDSITNEVYSAATTFTTRYGFDAELASSPSVFARISVAVICILPSLTKEPQISKDVGDLAPKSLSGLFDFYFVMPDAKRGGYKVYSRSAGNRMAKRVFTIDASARIRFENSIRKTAGLTDADPSQLPAFWGALLEYAKIDNAYTHWAWLHPDVSSLGRLTSYVDSGILASRDVVSFVSSDEAKRGFIMGSAFTIIKRRRPTLQKLLSEFGSKGRLVPNRYAHDAFLEYVASAFERGDDAFSFRAYYHVVASENAVNNVKFAINGDRLLLSPKATPALRSAKSSVEQVGVDIISKWTASGVPDGIWYVDRARASSAPYARRSLNFEVVKRKRSTVFRYSKESLENIFDSPQTAGLPFIHITGESSPRFEVAFATKAHDHDHTHTRL